ncbi:MAG: ABC transporter permease [Chitinophagaceae bacterium]|uniref:ABC transporter permease n=1 Tax=unclassified Paraflavitalea TaxID=2798305 RepID=UPI003D3263FE|nr:ABC transporter permease [Chitinophagaceae bacterium]
MNIAAFIARRVAFSGQKSFSRFIVRLSVAATIISVAVMIVTLAFAGGFQQTISNKVFSFFGHVRVINYNSTQQVAIAEELPVRKSDSVLNLPKMVPGIKKVQAYATKNAILKTTETIEGVLFKGVEKNYGFDNLKNFLVEGRWINFDDSSYNKEINLSASMAKQLNLKVKDQVMIFFIQPNGAPPRPRKLTVVGIFKTGIEEYDKLFALGDLRLIQRLNDWTPEQIGGYELILDQPNDMDRVSYDIVPYLPFDVTSQTIKESFPSIFDWLQLQDQTIYIVMAIMMVIATLNLITCLLILVLERTRMIGLLKALGSPNGTVQRIFLYQGSIISGVGILGGLLLGLLMCWLQYQYGFITLSEDTYYISKAAVYLVWWQVALVVLATFVVCFLILLIPSAIVKTVQPIRAIQFR